MDKSIYLTNENEKLKMDNIRLMRKCCRLANKNNIEMNDIRTTQSSADSAEQNFWFLQRIITVGGIFRL